MSLLKRIALFAALCLALEINAEVKTMLHKRIYVPKHTVPLYSPNLKDGNLDKIMYAWCDTGSDQPEKTCQVTLDSNTESVKSCNVTLKATTTVNGRIGSYSKLYRFGSNRAVLLWFEIPGVLEKSSAGYVKCSTIDLIGCQVKHVDVQSSEWPMSAIRNSSLVFHDESYVVMSLCGDKHCNTTIDAQGDVIKGPVASAYEYSGIGIDDSQVILIKIPSGWHKPLKEIGSVATYDRPVAFSRAHNTLSVAVGNSTDLIAWQFDNEGNTKLDTRVKIRNNLFAAGIHNLAEGGVLLLALACSKDCSDNEIRFNVMKIGANGKHSGSLQIPEPNLICNFKGKSNQIPIFENKLKEYCLYFVCPEDAKLPHSETDGKHVNMLVKCFSDKDFSASQSSVITIF